jgi:hypothetical protein
MGRNGLTTHVVARIARSDYIFFVPTRARKRSVANADAAIAADLTRAIVIAVSIDEVMPEPRMNKLFTDSARTLLPRDL